MLAKRLATLEPLVFTALVLVAAVSPAYMRMNGFSPLAAIPSNLVIIGLMLGWYVSILRICVRAFPAAEPNFKPMLALAAGIGLALVADCILLALRLPTGPTPFVAAGFYLLFLWRTAAAFARALNGTAEVKTAQVAAIFFPLWINIVGVWTLRKRILAVAERA